ncbi:hypothetical protein ACFO7V_16690 [Glutamicibacter bergerei]|uniref:Uncharacterized protein n=1 Tax=Glutamicibacter bergerei TaxID=256702 RepID=A0ABV9MRG4_9MICC|nr:hypothetical protein [Micrococcaceae bacterium]
MTNQPPLNPDALAHARSAAFDCWENGGNMDDLAECAIEAYLAVAQPVVNSVESLPASLQCIAWEEEPEHGLWKITEDETFVGLIVKSGRSWSPADKYTLRIERPEVPGA